MLSDAAIEIMEGELLGDGGLESSATSGNPGFAHSTANFCYSCYLEKSLADKDLYTNVELLPSRNGGKPQRRICTPNNQAFRSLLARWYPQGTKVVPEDLVLTRIKCLHWYLGDGYVEKKNAKLSTCGFTWDEVRHLVVMLGTLGFRASVDRHSGGYPVMRLLTKDSLAFLEWLGKYPVEG